MSALGQKRTLAFLFAVLDWIKWAALIRASPTLSRYNPSFAKRELHNRKFFFETVNELDACFLGAATIRTIGDIIPVKEPIGVSVHTGCERSNAFYAVSERTPDIP